MTGEGRGRRELRKNRENVLGNFYVPIKTRLQFFNAAVNEGTSIAQTCLFPSTTGHWQTGWHNWPIRWGQEYNKIGPL